MRQTIALITLMIMLSFSVSAYAEELPETQTASVYPIDVTCNEDSTEIRKIYELQPGEELPVSIQADFKQKEFQYTFFDLLREEIWKAENKDWKENVSVSSSKKDMDTVLSLLEPTKEITTEDGFTGILTLDIASIKSEVSGYGSSTKDISVTRTYPNLANADLQYIPKTTEENGKTLNFQNVEWRTDNTMNVDDYEIGDRYTAVVTYGGTSTSSYVKGYTITASYTGSIEKTYVEKERYVAIFTGSEIPKPFTGVNPWFLAPVGIVALGGLVWTFLWQRKGKKHA